MSSAVSRGQLVTSPQPLPALPSGSTYVPPQSNSNSNTREAIESLQQAANYAALSGAPLPEPHDITSAMMHLSHGSEDWSSFPPSSSSTRPTMLPRGESTKTINGRRSSRPGLEISTSSEVLTPAARIVSNPFEKGTLAERLERKVESPLHPSSDGETDSESYPSSLATSSDSAANLTSPVGVPHRTSLRSASLHPNYGTPLFRSNSPLGRIASPDSWRSLLPEDDPYFAADTEELSPEQDKMLFSDDGSANRPEFSRHGSGESSSASSAIDGSRRFSSSSSLGSFGSSLSLLPPIAIAAGPNDDWPVDSWRSLLPPSEPVNRRSSASPSPSSMSSAQSSPLAARDDDAGRTSSRLAAIAIANRDSSIRRPASFSTFDEVTPTLGHRAQGTQEGASKFSNPASPPASGLNRSAAYSRAAPVADTPRSASLSGSMASSYSPRRYARTAMENDDEREGWPCSRNYSEQPAVEASTADSPLSFRRHSVHPGTSFKPTTSRTHVGQTTPSSKLKPAVITTSSTAILRSVSAANEGADAKDKTPPAPAVVATTVVTTTTTTGDETMPSSQSTSSITTSLPMHSPLGHAAPRVPFQ